MSRTRAPSAPARRRFSRFSDWRPKICWSHAHTSRLGSDGSGWKYSRITRRARHHRGPNRHRMPSSFASARSPDGMVHGCDGSAHAADSARTRAPSASMERWAVRVRHSAASCGHQASWVVDVGGTSVISPWCRSSSCRLSHPLPQRERAHRAMRAARWGTPLLALASARSRRRQSTHGAPRHRV